MGVYSATWSVCTSTPTYPAQLFISRFLPACLPCCAQVQIPCTRERFIVKQFIIFYHVCRSENSLKVRYNQISNIASWCDPNPSFLQSPSKPQKHYSPPELFYSSSSMTTRRCWHNHCVGRVKTKTQSEGEPGCILSAKGAFLVGAISPRPYVLWIPCNYTGVPLKLSVGGDLLDAIHGTTN